MGHGLVPKPWKVPKCLAASYTLYPGASPLLVPAWLPEIKEGGEDEEWGVAILWWLEIFRYFCELEYYCSYFVYKEKVNLATEKGRCSFPCICRYVPHCSWDYVVLVSDTWWPFPWSVSRCEIMHNVPQQTNEQFLCNSWVASHKADQTGFVTVQRPSCLPAASLVGTFVGGGHLDLSWWLSFESFRRNLQSRRRRFSQSS